MRRTEGRMEEEGQIKWREEGKNRRWRKRRKEGKKKAVKKKEEKKEEWKEVDGNQQVKEDWMAK
jgi:hypothetical protein